MKKRPNRQRCLTVGCNPMLTDEGAAKNHREATGHRTAKWPVRSAEGERRARIRNKTGYYDKYNVGAKSAVARGLVPGVLGVLSEPDVPSSTIEYWRKREEREEEYFEEYGISEEQEHLDADYQEYLWDRGF
ncbi:hypothetical protein QYM46_13150 [Brevibacterium sp. K11IcPPYGO002]|uniref:hypothetical protein n=1 Tax=Brevibacterium sp. K11IcPPYGO002 TaxID=3058837 RepID=UPI003D8160EA